MRNVAAMAFDTLQIFIWREGGTEREKAIAKQGRRKHESTTFLFKEGGADGSELTVWQWHEPEVAGFRITAQSVGQYSRRQKGKIIFTSAVQARNFPLVCCLSVSGLAQNLIRLRLSLSSSAS